MVRKAEELCAKNGWFLCHQFENEAKRVAVRNEPLIWSTVVSRDNLTHWLISSQLEVPRGHDRSRNHR